VHLDIERFGKDPIPKLFFPLLLLPLNPKHMVSLNCFGDRNSCDVEEKEVWERTHLFFFFEFREIPV
jgi:hypothetical protein